jgi:ribonuclease J
VANADIAVRTGVPRSRVLLADDGVVVDLGPGGAQISGKVPAGYVYVDGMTVGGATEASLKDRRTLAQEGFITIVIIVDSDSGTLAETPDFLARGFEHDDTTFDAVVPLIEKAMANASSEGIGERHQIEQLIRRTVSRWANDTYRRNPIILPIVIDA